MPSSRRGFFLSPRSALYARWSCRCSWSYPVPVRGHRVGRDRGCEVAYCPVCRSASFGATHRDCDLLLLRDCTRDRRASGLVDWLPKIGVPVKPSARRAPSKRRTRKTRRK